jgi:hypothetical protein
MLLAYSGLSAQKAIGPADQVTVTFRLLYRGNEIVPGDRYLLPDESDPVSVEVLRFYVSDLQLFRKGKPVSLGKFEPLLVDAEVPESRQAEVAVGKGSKFDEIRFHLGLDSLTNVSGALGGDLDPTKGMYWTWQSGYVNFKLEGESPVCPTRNHAFSFHLGGYMHPFASMQTVSLKCAPGNHLVVEVVLDEFMRQIDLSTTHTVMSPGEQAVELSRMLQGIFRLKQ